MGAASGPFMQILSQVATDDKVSPWLTTGSAGLSIAALVYIAKLMASGKLVARDPDTVERSLIDLTKRVTDLAEESHKREDLTRQLEDRLLQTLLENKKREG